jgi:hypothetical protein
MSPIREPRTMRPALVSLFVLAAAASAYAQTPAQPAEPAPPALPAAAQAPSPAAAPPATGQAQPEKTPAPAQAPAPPAPPEGQPAANPAPAETAAAPPPPAPPAPPTDATAVEVLAILQQVCIPAASGGDFARLAKAAGLRKNSDGGWSVRQREFTLTLLSPGSNPTQCHVDVTHPADLDSPGRPIIVALNDWAAVEHGWSLYRNDRSVQAGMQFTTRSWQLDSDGKEQSLVFTTTRKPDGSPLRPNTDQSEMIYGVARLPS